MKPSDYQEIGQYLRDSRESLRITREDAARVLHIRAKYLEALEAGDLKDLPGKAYIRGYIRNYAQFLRLNVEEVLDAYSPLLGPRTQELFIPEPTLRQNIPSRGLIWLSFIGLLLVYGYWYLAFHDRTLLARIVAHLPARLAQLLDKPLPPGLNSDWAKCLKDGQQGCYTILLLNMTLTPDTTLYDIRPEDIAPQKP